MFDKKYIIDAINRDLKLIRGVHALALCQSRVESEKSSFWGDYLTALKVRDARLDVLSAFGYKPVYDSEHYTCLDIVPITYEKIEVN